jgi:hypothetical protein
MASTLGVAAPTMRLREAPQESLGKRLFNFLNQTFSLALVHFDSPASTPRLSLASGAGYGDEILYYDAPAHIPLKACIFLIAGTFRSKLMFQGADRLADSRPLAARTTWAMPRSRADFSLAKLQNPRSAVANRGT